MKKLAESNRKEWRRKRGNGERKNALGRMERMIRDNIQRNTKEKMKTVREEKAHERTKEEEGMRKRGNKRREKKHSTLGRKKKMIREK